MGVSLCEQETTINFSRDSDVAEIYTSDRTAMTRFDRLANDKNCPDWKCTGVQRDRNGEIVAKTYRTKKRLISYRSVIRTHEYTDEEREEQRERGRHLAQISKERKKNQTETREK